MIDSFFLNDLNKENQCGSELLNDLINNNELYILVTDQKGKLLHATQNITELTGYQAEDLKHLKLSELFLPQFKEKVLQQLNSVSTQTKNSGSKNHLPLTLKNKSTLWCEMFSTTSNHIHEKQHLINHVIKNIHEHKQLKDNFSDTESFQKLVINNIPDPIFVKDSDFNIVLANEAFLNLYPEDQRTSLLGTTTLENYDPDEMAAFLEKDKITFKEGFTQTIERITFPTGQIRTLETQKIRFENIQNQPFLLGISEDITENHELIERLKKSNSDLNEFSYIAAHDLKSPMNAIRKIAGWLYQDCAEVLNESSLKHLEMLMSRSERMLKLLDDLLVYSTIEKKDYPYNKIDFESAISQLIDNHDCQVSYQLNMSMPAYQVPKIPFKTIFNNLISNAIKHHPNLTPNIVISMYRKNNYDWLVFEDDGNGIPTEFRADALQVFKTLKPRDQVEGSGVGLSLIKKMSEYYSGVLNLDESELGGLKVTIKWPINKFFKQE